MIPMKYPPPCSGDQGSAVCIGSHKYIYETEQKVYGNEVDNVVPMLCIVQYLFEGNHGSCFVNKASSCAFKPGANLG